MFPFFFFPSFFCAQKAEMVRRSALVRIRDPVREKAEQLDSICYVCVCASFFPIFLFSPPSLYIFLCQSIFTRKKKFCPSKMANRKSLPSLAHFRHSCRLSKQKFISSFFSFCIGYLDGAKRKEKRRRKDWKKNSSKTNQSWGFLEFV